jgi:anti-sigma factor RsiW
MMDPRPPNRIEALLTRAFDGEATDAERAELSSLVDVEPRLAAMSELRAALVEALAVPGPVDLAAEVMAVLDAEAGWGPLGAELRGSIGVPVDLADQVMASLFAEAEWAPTGNAMRAALAAPSIDIADGVMAALNTASEAPDPEMELSAYYDGMLSPERTAAVAARLLSDPLARYELAAFADVGESLRDATVRGTDLWPAVADGVGVERDALHGWDAVARPLRDAFDALPDIDIATAVMAAIEPARHRMPLWASLGAPVAGLFAAAAAVMFVVLYLPSTGGVPVAASILELGKINDAQVEEISARDNSVVQVMQFEDGGPTFILVDDPGVPL